MATFPGGCQPRSQVSATEFGSAYLTLQYLLSATAFGGPQPASFIADPPGVDRQSVNAVLASPDQLRTMADGSVAAIRAMCRP